MAKPKKKSSAPKVNWYKVSELFSMAEAARHVQAVMLMEAYETIEPKLDKLMLRLQAASQYFPDNVGLRTDLQAVMEIRKSLRQAASVAEDQAERAERFISEAVKEGNL